jgi:hypothetical protein
MRLEQTPIENNNDKNDALDLGGIADDRGRTFARVHYAWLLS